MLVLSAAVSTPARAAVRSDAAESYAFAFQDAEVAQVAQEVLGAVGHPFAVDPSANARLTFRIEQRLTRDQLLAAFEVVLQSNGLALVRNGDQLLVTAEAKAKSAAPVRRRSQGEGAGFEIVAVPVSFAEPSEVAKALEAISSTTNILYANDKLGLMVLGGDGAQIKQTLETLKIFDQSAFEDSKIRWFELSQAQAGTVADELQKIVQGSGMTGVSIIPLRRLNGLIVFARSADGLTEIAKWVGRLDTAGKEATSSLWVYHPRATSAEDLARTLNSLMGLQSSVETTYAAGGEGSSGARLATSNGAPVVATTSSLLTSGGNAEDQIRVAVDKPSNTLIVIASPGRWVQVQRVLGEIDRTPRQILIEASILEVTLNKDFEFGVDWSILSHDLSVSSINNSTGTVGPSSPGLSITFLNNDIEAAVHALGSRTDVEVVSAPKIIALDSRTAHLQVGDQVPVVTQSAQSRNDSNAPLVNSVDYRSTGVILTVTPRVTGDDQLVLEVTQEVSSVGKTSTSGIDSPTIQQRRFESALVMHDGGVVALGGLISTNRTRSTSGVPLLQDIPAVGALFRSHSDDRGRSELIVLLKAKIIRDGSSSDAVMRDLFDDMHELQVRGLTPARK